MTEAIKTGIRSVRYLLGRAVFAGVVLLIAASTRAQNLFVADLGDGKIYEFTPSGTRSTFASAGPNGPNRLFASLRALAFNSAGDLFVVNGSDISVITPSGVDTIFAVEGPSFELAFNSAGDLFATDISNGDIFEFTTNGTESTFASGLDDPNGLAFDSAGNLFVSLSQGINTGDIYEFTPSGAESNFVSGLTVGQMAFNSAGDLFVLGGTNYTNYSVIEITPSKMQSTFASGLNAPNGLAFDSAGDLFVANTGAGNIIEIAANGMESIFASGLDEPYGLAFQPVPGLQAAASNGTFQLTVLMPSPYYPTIVQASSDLVNWCNICTNTPPFTFTDSASPESLCRFYRALVAP